MTYEPFKHQQETINFLATSPIAFITSDPGTGKTRCVIDDYDQNLKDSGRLLVFAPLSILKPSWADDIEKFAPDLTWAIAHGKNKEAAFHTNAQIIIMNHDGVKWLAQNMHLLAGVVALAIDESTAFKNRTSQRSKAMKKIADVIPVKRLMTGTPNPNTVQDLWHQVMLLDKGQRLGSTFYKFRDQVCETKQVGPKPEHVQWIDKDMAQEMVADCISDITIRHKFEDCVDVPEHTMRNLYIDLPAKVRRAYVQFDADSVMHTATGNVTAVHAGSKVKKLLQLLTGCIYDADGNVHQVHTERYSLVIDLIKERESCVVAFNWRHEREQLVELATKAGITFGVIDGETPVSKRSTIVDDFQSGKIQVVFAHPQSAGHGLTLTRGTTTIWSSPTYNAEHFQQFNRRIYRAGQTRKTETICIAARETKEVDVYEKLSGKMARMEDILDLFKTITDIKLKEAI